MDRANAGKVPIFTKTTPSNSAAGSTVNSVNPSARGSRAGSAVPESITEEDRLLNVYKSLTGGSTPSQEQWNEFLSLKRHYGRTPNSQAEYSEWVARLRDQQQAAFVATTSRANLTPEVLKPRDW